MSKYIEANKLHINNKENQKKVKPKPNNNNEKTVIVAGMGPGGMVAAIEAIKKGYNVMIYEARDHYTRSQTVYVQEEAKEFLFYNSPPEMKDEVEAILKKGECKINQLQKLLQRTLEYTAEKARLAGTGGKLEIRKGSEYEIVGFNLENGKNQLKVKTKGKDENIPFDFFVAADGGKRTMAKKLNMAFGKEKIAYKDLEVQTRRAPHGTLTLRAKPPWEQVVTQYKENLDTNDINRLKSLGWEEPFPPKCYMFENDKSNQFYLAGEIPQSILDTKDLKKQAEKLTEWGKLIMKLQYGIVDPESMLELDVKDVNTPNEQANKLAAEENKMVTTAFELRLQYTDTPCVELNGNAHFVSIGDATMNANFYLGHGANDAIKDGLRFGKFLPTKENEVFNKDQFILERRRVKNSIRDAMNAIQLVDTLHFQILLNRLTKSFIGTDKQPGRSQYLIDIARPLVQYDKNLKKELSNFEDLLKKYRKNPGNVKPDDVYNQVLILSNSINTTIDKKAAMEIGKIENELEKIRGQIFKLTLEESKPMASELTKMQRFLEKEELESQAEKLTDAIAKYKEYVQKTKDQDITRQIVNDIPFLIGYERLKMQQDKSSPSRAPKKPGLKK